MQVSNGWIRKASQRLEDFNCVSAVIKACNGKKQGGGERALKRSLEKKICVERVLHYTLSRSLPTYYFQCFFI